MGNLEHVKQKNEMLEISRNHITLRSCFLFAVVNVIKVKERCVILDYFVFFWCFCFTKSHSWSFQRPFFPLCRHSHLVGLSSLFIFIKGKDSEGSWRHPKPWSNHWLCAVRTLRRVQANELPSQETNISPPAVLKMIFLLNQFVTSWVWKGIVQRWFDVIWNPIPNDHFGVFPRNRWR